jgi:hypothetical protein
VVARGCAVPADRPLDDLTVELVELLGDPDPHLRDDLALRVLCSWISEGVYDDLLSALGDGVSEGLRLGLGEHGDRSVLRRSFSARVVAAAVDRDSAHPVLLPGTVLDWGDRGLSWLVAERDLRGHVPGAGRAHAMLHGAELLRALALSRHLDEGGLMVLLDTLADRLLRPTGHVFVSQEEDRLAYATMAMLHRGLVDMALLDPWVERLAAGWSAVGQPGEPVPPEALNTMSFARALHLQLLLGVRATDAASVRVFGGRPSVRVDLLAALQRALRETGPYYERKSV